MNKTQLKNVLDYLSKHDESTASKAKNEYTLSEWFDPEPGGYDSVVVQVDLNKKIVMKTTWHESYHNGDFYGETTTPITWDVFFKKANVICERAKRIALNEVRRKEEEERQRQIEKKGNELLSQIFDGEF